ncbi:MULTISPECIES: ANTAR domain-containing protein [unclassified Streptomyces]|uniref:ANTAR domain-containing protein n=1 Tax=unclassified Streptomyces TaxID=2593676 RepID=UPI002DD929E3|nr:ANTAR domain-containing protein [Streptomyces sp. NBC_01750]WSB04602.1 ANTAR domain-containing protein [Streptomyces sp. NBC_01794]WSD31114.1 ANTAR domain-containing protein [Streptomyces sp. NBC_01750]
MTRMDDTGSAPRSTSAAAWAASDETQYRVVGANLEVQALREELAGLRHALSTHPVIDMARGVIMATASCTPDQAWQVLVSVSQHTNIKLRDIAQHIVEGVAGEPPAEPIRAALRSALSALPDHRRE